MAKAPARISAASRAGAMQRRQWLLGLLLTLLVAFLWHNGGLEFLERQTIDWRAKFFNFTSPEPSDRLAVIAIDDAALENVGRWPWDRAKLAAVIEELRLAGTSVVALDLLLDDAQAPRLIELPRLARAASGAAQEVAEIRDDEILADAIRRHGSVIVAASFPFKREEASRSSVASTSAEDAPVVVRLPDLYAILDKHAEFRPQADRPIAAELERGVAEAASRLPDFQKLTVTRGPQFDKLSLRWNAATTLLARERDSTIPLPSDVRPWATSTEASAPVPAFGLAAARIANVTFDTYDPDGQTRRVPLWVSHHGHLWPTLGLAAVLQSRKIPMEGGVAITGDATILNLPDHTTQTIETFRARVSQAEVDGLHFVTWPRSLWGKGKEHADLTGWQWQFFDLQGEKTARAAGDITRRFECEVPIGRVYEPVRIAETVQDNMLDIIRCLAVLNRQQLLDPAAGARVSADWEALRNHIAHARDQKGQQLALGYGVGEAKWNEALVFIKSIYPKAAADAQTLIDLSLEGTTLDKLPEPDRSNIADLQGALAALPHNFDELANGLERIGRERTALKQRLSGKICFVGWTATGSVSDFVATSIHPRTPGVHVHVAVANSVLTGFQRTPGPAWGDLLMLIVLGVLGTWAGVRAGVLAAPIVVAVLILAWFGTSSGLLWDLWRSIWSISGPAVAAAFGWMVVLLHRLLVEQRSRRKTEERFKSYVSPQVVDILVNNPELTTMKPQERELTVLFTDLVGFTTIAERLGSEGTAALLAKFLGTMTETIQAEKATLDKYIGDAIVAFWGAPVEDPNHATNACRAALKMFERLDAMNAAAEFGADLELRMRIGLASGEVMVGDFGNPPRNSSYTVIGDTVNLGSRLEGANKAFGTRILVSDRVRELAGDKDFNWRRMGRIRVVGRHQGVWVHELLSGTHKSGRTEEWIALSEAMIADYQAQRFPDALEKTLRLRTDFSDDYLAAAYEQAIAAWQGDHVEGDFDGCIILAEK